MFSHVGDSKPFESAFVCLVLYRRRSDANRLVGQLTPLFSCCLEVILSIAQSVVVSPTYALSCICTAFTPPPTPPLFFTQPNISKHAPTEVFDAKRALIGYIRYACIMDRNMAANVLRFSPVRVRHTGRIGNCDTRCVWM